MTSFSTGEPRDPNPKPGAGIDFAWLRERYGLLLRYGCDVAKLPQRYAQKFVQLAPDVTLRHYLSRIESRRHGWAMTRLHRGLRSVLSDFDINGILGTYPMHVLGTQQFRFLFDAVENSSDGPVSRSRLLDVGAGNGDVTGELAPLFDSVSTTEVSGPMCRRLRRRGFRCHHLDVAERGLPEGPYDVVTCLNVLDRCARPLKLLAEIRAGLGEGGLLLIALVLPYSPFVYDGPVTRDPDERLPVSASGWESAVVEFSQGVVEPLGLSIEAIARAPYLSQGDAAQAVYELDDALIVCRAQGVPLQVGSLGG